MGYGTIDIDIHKSVRRNLLILIVGIYLSQWTLFGIVVGISGGILIDVSTWSNFTKKLNVGIDRF